MLMEPMVQRVYALALGYEDLNHRACPEGSKQDPLRRDPLLLVQPRNSTRRDL
jgi:hypothetical protein